MVSVSFLLCPTYCTPSILITLNWQLVKLWASYTNRQRIHPARSAWSTIKKAGHSDSSRAGIGWIGLWLDCDWRLQEKERGLAESAICVAHGTFNGWPSPPYCLDSLLLWLLAAQQEVATLTLCTQVQPAVSHVLPSKKTVFHFTTFNKTKVLWTALPRNQLASLTLEYKIFLNDIIQPAPCQTSALSRRTCHTRHSIPVLHMYVLFSNAPPSLPFIVWPADFHIS